MEVPMDSNNKQGNEQHPQAEAYARIKVIDAFCARLEKALKSRRT